MDPGYLYERLAARTSKGLLRKLRLTDNGIDFYSNDYLGVAKDNLLEADPAIPNNSHASGSTGSRLLSGNSLLAEQTEEYIANFHQAESALLFNSGYDANLGLLSCIASKEDTILYDQLCHASIRDGIRLSYANSWSFEHNNCADLLKKIEKASGTIYVVTESVFSMDGDLAPIQEILSICQSFDARLIVDEAHATGIIGEQGEGLMQSLNLHNECFARVYTYGKAFGCHGAAIAGSSALHDYLVNFCRPFIYSTAMPPASVAAIRKAYEIVPGMTESRNKLKSMVEHFQQSNLILSKLRSTTPIQGILVAGNENAHGLATLLQHEGFNIRPILYPTVPEGKERLRIIIHSYNTMEEVEKLINVINTKSGR